MGFLDSDIESYRDKLNHLESARAEILNLGLEPGFPAISKTAKKIVLLKNQVEVQLKKDKEGLVKAVTRIVAYDSLGKGEFYELTDLAPFTDASRILYLK